MSVEPDLGSAVTDLENLLVEMIASVLGEQSIPAGPLQVSAAATAVSRLVIYDVDDGSYLGVEVRASTELVSMLAANLLGVPDPAPDDMLDVIAELGNIAAGNVKTLLCGNGRLSLPSAAVVTDRQPDPDGGVQAAACLLGHVLELAVLPLVEAGAGTRWPPGFAPPAEADAGLAPVGP